MDENENGIQKTGFMVVLELWSQAHLQGTVWQVKGGHIGCKQVNRTAVG
jgi:hypothetical protein